MTKFSIVTPVYNGMPWLPDCIGSVVAQRADVDVELLVFDGGSTDGSREWLREHTELGYRLFFEPDEGQTDALIKGFERATGDIFGWLNADDLLEPGALGSVASAFGAAPDLVMVGGSCLVVDAVGDLRGLIAPPSAIDFRSLITQIDNPPQPATFFRAEAYRASGGLDRAYDLAMDVDLWLKLARRGRIEFLPRAILARYRVHGQAKSVKGRARTVRQDFAVRRRHGLPLRSEATALQLYRICVGLPASWARHAVWPIIRRTLRS